MKRRCFFVWWTLFLATPSLASTGEVTYVFDGDTIEVDHQAVRLIGINTPEIARKKYGTKDECYGLESKAYLESRVLGKKVKLKSDPQVDKKDKYGRTLAYVYLRGRLINKELVQQGEALFYPFFPFSKRAEFLRDQETAKAQQRGLWRACEVHCRGPYCKIEFKKSI